MLKYDGAYTVNKFIMMFCEYRVESQAYAAENSKAARNKCAREQTKQIITKDVFFQC